MQPTAAQALRSVPAEVQDHRGLPARPLLSGNRKKRVPATQGNNTTHQGPTVHRVGGPESVFYRPNRVCRPGRFIIDPKPTTMSIIRSIFIIYFENILNTYSKRLITAKLLHDTGLRINISNISDNYFFYNAFENVFETLQNCFDCYSIIFPHWIT